MKYPIFASLLFTAGLAAGFLLMPTFPNLGTGLVFASCSVILILQVRRASG